MLKPTLDTETLQRWIGKSQSTSSFIDARSVAQMQSIIHYSVAPKMGDDLPNLWHWMYTFPLAPLEALSKDGHPNNGDFMPTIALPRRMWAGGRVQFVSPLKVGMQMRCLSTIQNIVVKKGRSGNLCFVTLLHEFSSESELCISEEHDIVYRDEPASGAPSSAPLKSISQSNWSTQVTPSSVMLFRYSAATFNSHRIHYDREYALSEGYPGLVFHGPLTTTLLMKELQLKNPDKQVTAFSFKAISPLFDNSTFSLNGLDENQGKVDLWAANNDGDIAIKATAELS